MRPIDLIKLDIKIDDVWVDYTDGTIDIDIVRGIQNQYEGPWQQVEAGVLTLTTRNPNLDPYTNSDIRMNREVRVTALDDAIFTGRINGINVDYQPKGKPPIITISVIDMIGTMALHTLRDSFKTRLGSTMGMFGMLQELVYLNGSYPGYAGQEEIIGFTNPYRVGTGSGSGNAVNVPTGTTALSMATQLAQTDQFFFYADRHNDFYAYPTSLAKKDNPIVLEFDSRGGATSYRAVNLSDGFDLLTNQLSLTSYGTTIAPYINNFSASEWGSTRKDLDILIVGLTAQNATTDAIRDRIFQETVNPTREISSITFDGVLAPDSIHTTDILDNIYIYHEVDGFDIERKYGIIGINHNITENDWNVTLNLKNMFAYDTSFPTPTIAISPTSGTTSTLFTYTITNASELEIDTVEWTFGDGLTSTDITATHDYASNQAGTKQVRVKVNSKYGFTKYSAYTALQVSGAAPVNTWTYAVNSSDSSLIEFTFTGSDATSYLWNFGDGGTSTVKNPAHKFATSGSKTVTLTATNAYGSTATPQTFTVTVPPTPVDQVGNTGVRYIKLQQPANTASTINYYPRLARFRANTSTTLTNRAANKNVPYEWNYPGTVQEFVITGSPATAGILTVTDTSNPSWGFRPRRITAGKTQWFEIIDLGQKYYDLKTLQMKIVDYTSSIGLEVYFSKDVDNFEGPGAPAILDDNQWIKVATFSTATNNDNATPTYNQTLPLSL